MAEGEAPGCRRAIRTRSTAGTDPEAQRRVEHQRLAVDAGRRPGRPRPPRRPAPSIRARAAASGAALAAIGGRAEDGDPEQGVVDPRPGARPDRAAQPVAVVGHQHGRARVVRVAARAGPAQVELAAVRAEDVRHRVEQRAQLRVAVALPLHGLGVQAQRDVVHEHAAVHLGQVDRPLAAVHERVQRADHVVAIDAEVEREVVARPRRDAGVGQAVLGGERRDDGLRTVATRHRQRVGAAVDRPPHQCHQVLPGRQLDRLDAALARLVGEREALRLAATRAGVEEQHRPARGRGVRKGHADLERRPGGGERHQQPGHDQQLGEQGPARQQQHHDSAQRQRRDGEPRGAGGAAPQHAVPGRGRGDRHQAQQHQAAGELAHRDRNCQSQRRRPRRQRHERRDLSPAHTIPPT